ncbi:MAG TPA: DUF1566 domain-containing protein [Gammaproteobacteria bacterium]|nr:DUF1566 domain-containing protein [Gammaproteobacteria bacterium]
MQQLIDVFRAAMSQRIHNATPRDLLTMASRICDDDPRSVMASASPQGRLLLAPQWEIVSDDIVRDARTGLEYFRDDVPGGRRNWGDSMAAAAKLDVGGYHDWRAPDLREQLWMMDVTRCKPAYDTSIFRGNSDAWVWVNQDYKPIEGCAWVVDFDNGDADGYNRNNDGFVRAVRGGQY